MADGLRMSVRIEGLDELRVALQELPVKLQEKTLAAAVVKGARVVLARARKLVPVMDASDATPALLKRRTPGLLRRMLRVTRGVRRNTEAAAFVSVRRPSTKAVMRFKRETGRKSAENPNDPFYWSILEFGKSTRTARPFIRPAFEQTKREAAEAIKEALRRGIEKAASELVKRRA